MRGLLDEKGSLTDTYAYNAYGELTAKTGETENHFLYTGEYYDGVSGLYYLRARYMNPETGTFTSMDTWQGNLYEPVTLPIIVNYGMNILAMARSLKTAVYVIETVVALKLASFLMEAFTESGCSVINRATDVVTAFSIGFEWPWQHEREAEREHSVTLEQKADNMSTYYYVTSKENVIKILATGVLVNLSRWEGGYVFAWRNKPGKKAISYSGAQMSEVIIRFNTNDAFEDDPAFCQPGQNIPSNVRAAGPVRSVFPGPVKIYNPIIVANC